MAISTPVTRTALSSRLLGGGTDGNERLTTITGVVLLLLLAALGVTIVWIGRLLDVHMFLGMLLLAPVALKMGSTGYRFARYYAHEESYRRKGPPPLPLRLVAPVLVLTTVGVFATGVVLLLAGTASRDPVGEVHKVFFIVWVAFTGIHVLGHVLDLPRALRTRRTLLAEGEAPPAGGAGRGLALLAALSIGAIVAVLSIAQFAPWTRGH